MLFHQVVSLVTFYLATSSLPLSKSELVESPHQEKLANIRKANLFGLKEKDVEDIFEKRYGYRKLQSAPSDMPSKSLAPSGTPSISFNPSASQSPTSKPSAAPSASPTKKPTTGTNPTKKPTTKKPKAPTGGTGVICKDFKNDVVGCNSKRCCTYSVNKKGKGRCKNNGQPCEVKVKCAKIKDQATCDATKCKWKSSKNKCKKNRNKGKKRIKAAKKGKRTNKKGKDKKM